MPGTRLVDLGRVENIVEVRVNGQAAGVAWKGPYLLDITSLAAVVGNQLEVSVTNRVINRMINKKPTEADLPLSGPKAA